MEITAFLMENNLFSPLFLLLIPFFLLFITKQYYTSVKNLPPGPRPWPIIGNIHQMGSLPYVSTAIWAKKYGPLISFRLGTQITVVASSPETAAEILKTQDRFLCARALPDALHLIYTPFYFVWAIDCNEHWKSLRTFCRTEMFSAKALEAQTSLKNEKLTQMIDFLSSKQGKVVKIEEVVFTTMFNTLSNIMFGKDFLDLKDEHGIAGGLKDNLTKILEGAATPSISDFFPMLGRLDLQGLRKEAMKNLRAVESYWEGMIKEKRAKINSSKPVAEKDKCFVDRLLENGFTNDQITILALELFTAGTDTTTSTIEWAMAELMRNKEVMIKVRKELKENINSNTVNEYDLSKLSYLNAFIKEILRLRPVVPLLIPRRALESCEIMGYEIPKSAQIWINIWAINRDPKLWDDPLSFKPERFLDSNLDYKGQDFEFIPFGAGRRMCPGLPFGVKSVQSILASLILQFDWLLPNDEDPTSIDMNGKFGTTLQKKKPLELIFKHLE